jgi:hypothetical protein
MGTVGCVAGVVLAIGVWTVAGLTLGHLDAGGLAMVGVAGLAAGGVPSWLLLKTRGRHWVRDVLLPEAEGVGVSPEWVLAVLEGTAPPKGAVDDLSGIREIVPTLHAELVAGGRDPDGGGARFGLPPRRS